MIKASDVIIPGNYPENSQDSFKIGLFVVVSKKHQTPTFFQRDKLWERERLIQNLCGHGNNATTK